MTVPNVSLGSCPAADSALCAGGTDAHLDTTQRLTLSPTGHLAVAICLGFIGILGFLNNFLVLVLFCRYRVLRSPINLLLVNISVSDLLVCVVGTPFSFAASTQGRWLIGEVGCVWYGFANSLLGIVSLISLAVLSYERCCTMTDTTEADPTNYRKIGMGIGLSWVYSLAWTLPPLFGWSAYGPEGPGTTCSVNWTLRNMNGVSYIISLFVFCLTLPFFVILYSYGKLLHVVKQVGSVNTAMSRKRERRILLMVVVMVICYLSCWLPYSMVALVAAFGRPGLITAELSIVPSLLAKSSTAINPVIYIFMNKQFYRCFRSLLMCDAPWKSSRSRSSSKGGRPRLMVHHNNNTVMVAWVKQAPTMPGAKAGSEGPSAPTMPSAEAGSEGSSASGTEPGAILLMAPYSG